MSEVSLKSEVWNWKWGVSLWLLYKLNNVKRVIAWQERIELVKVQCPNITEFVVCVLYLWLSRRFRIKAKQNKKTCGWEKTCVHEPTQSKIFFFFSFERFSIRSSYSSGGIYIHAHELKRRRKLNVKEMKKHDSRRLCFLTNSSYASLDVLSLNSPATLFTCIHNTIYTR